MTIKGVRCGACEKVYVVVDGKLKQHFARKIGGIICKECDAYVVIGCARKAPKAATKIQSVWRLWSRLRKVKAATKIQSIWWWSVLRKATKAATKIQSIWRMCRVVRGVPQATKAATKIQSIWRMYDRLLWCGQSDDPTLDRQCPAAVAARYGTDIGFPLCVSACVSCFPSTPGTYLCGRCDESGTPELPVDEGTPEYYSDEWCKQNNPPELPVSQDRPPLMQKTYTWQEVERMLKAEFKKGFQAGRVQAQAAAPLSRMAAKKSPKKSPKKPKKAGGTRAPKKPDEICPISGLGIKTLSSYKISKTDIASGIITRFIDKEGMTVEYCSGYANKHNEALQNYLSTSGYFIKKGSWGDSSKKMPAAQGWRLGMDYIRYKEVRPVESLAIKKWAE